MSDDFQVEVDKQLDTFRAALKECVEQCDAANAEIERLRGEVKLLQQLRDSDATHYERLRAELAASGNYIANAEVAPTFIAFANKRTVKIVDGALEVGWLDDRDEEIAGPVAWKYAVGIKGSLALDQVSKLKAELAACRNAALEDAEDAMLGVFAGINQAYLFTSGFDNRIIDARDAIRALKREGGGNG